MVTAGSGGGWATDEVLVMPTGKSCRKLEEFLSAYLLIVAARTVWACVFACMSVYELHRVDIVRFFFQLGKRTFPVFKFYTVCVLNIFYSNARLEGGVASYSLYSTYFSNQSE